MQKRLLGLWAMLLLAALGCNAPLFSNNNKPTTPVDNVAAAPCTAQPAASANAAGSVDALFAVLPTSGFYAFTLQDLKAAGLALDAQAAAQVQATQMGYPLSLWRTTGDNPCYVFYSPITVSPYQSQNTVRVSVASAPLDWQPSQCGTVEALQIDASPMLVAGGLPVPNATLSVASTADFFYTSRYFESNMLYSPFASSEDAWFWAKLGAKPDHTISFELDDLADTGDVHLQVSIWSNTQDSVDPDHHIVLQLNGQPIGEDRWDGAGTHTVEATVAANQIKSGTNELTVTMPRDVAENETDFVNALTVYYPHAYPSTAAQQLLFGNGSQDLSKWGQSIWLADVTNQNHPVCLPATTESPQFEATVSTRYVVSSMNALLPVQWTVASGGTDLRSLAGADYLAIGNAELLAAVQPLLDFHQKNGLSTATATLTDIYTQFGEGVPNPYVIQSFIRATQEWQVKPRFILLLGDATYDPRANLGELTQAGNLLPTFFVRSQSGGETASDVLFGDVNGDNTPDLSVGRMPARTPAQISLLVQKTLAYNAASDVGWHNKILAVADPDSSEPFAEHAQQFLGKLKSYQTDLFAPTAEQTDSVVELTQYFNEGRGLVAYFGHGSIVQWGKTDILRAENVPDLKNSNLPIVVTITCLTGMFIHPEVESLTETLLWQTDGGAVAALSPTAPTFSSAQHILSDAFAAALESSPDLTLGEWLLEAQRHLARDDANQREVLETFLLFGDPALRLNGH